MVVVVGAFTALGRDPSKSFEEVMVEVECTGRFASTKVCVGGGGCGTCKAECAEDVVKVPTEVCVEGEVAPGDGERHTEKPAVLVYYAEA